MRFTPAEALSAVTNNTACAINRQEKVGSLEVGNQADGMGYRSICPHVIVLNRRMADYHPTHCQR
ncbi:amidohydrolase family protein [Peribacillus simplex]|uniref:amidohydrolase family protein n=1 Tax=Peribacillus simplex TaxID=1478 RepID=UPI003D2B165D